MLAQQNRRGAVAGIVVAVIVLVLVLGGIWYFVSDPFHQKVNDAIKSNTKWTEENIKKDQAGYLSYCLEQVDKTKGRLDAAQLALTKQKINVNEKLQKNTTAKSQCEVLLQKLRDAYTNAKAKNEWPVIVKPFTFDDERDLKAKIVNVNDYLNGAKDRIAEYTKDKDRVADQLFDIDQKLQQIEKLNTKLSIDLDEAKAKREVEGIGNISGSLDEIVTTSQALSETAEKNTSISEALKPKGDERINEEFDKIMGKGKDAKK